MDQAIDNQVSSHSRSTEKPLGSRLHFTLGSLTRPADAKKQ